MVALNAIAYGGGVQSTALVVLATQGDVAVSHALFANVGDDSENPETLTYVRDIVTPWAAARGVTVHELHRVTRVGARETLLERLTRAQRSIDIPLRMSPDGAPGNRNCTNTFKLKVLAKWLKSHGATALDPATLYIGISWDEIERLNNRVGEPYERVEYPLIDRRLTRHDCKNLIARAGLPVPPKSSCYFCPYKRTAEWQALRKNAPALFEKAADIETMLNTRRETLGKDAIYLTRFLVPLREAIPEQTQMDFDFSGVGGETCDDGVCWV